jgi:hypothetical protein
MAYWLRPSVRLVRSGRELAGGAQTRVKARDRSVLERGLIRNVENNFIYVTPQIPASACAASKACEIVPAPTLAVERESSVVGQSGALELRQRRRDRLATGDARKGLPERKHVQQGVVEATTGHWARYVSGVADECDAPRNEPSWPVLGDRSSEATACAQTHLYGAPPRIRPELPRPFLKRFP